MKDLLVNKIRGALADQISSYYSMAVNASKKSLRYHFLDKAEGLQEALRIIQDADTQEKEKQSQV
jgi:pyrroloquinoline quinone (PQQ) biosynthesis protein C